MHFQTSTVQALNFGNGYIISSHTILGMWLLIHAVLIHVDKRGPMTVITAIVTGNVMGWLFYVFTIRPIYNIGKLLLTLDTYISTKYIKQC